MIASPDIERPELTRSILRGALVNALGSGGKLLYPLLLLLITRIYGPSNVGAFLLLLSVVELVSCITIEGFDAAVITYGPGAAQREGDEGFYAVVAAALQWSMALSGAAFALALAGAPILARTGWERNGMAEAVRVAGISLPMMAFTCIVIAATRARLTMTFDAAINGFVKPIALIGAALGLGSRAPTSGSLYAAYLIAQGVCAAAALGIVVRVFSGRRLLAHVLKAHPMPGLLSFGFSSGAGSLFNAFTANAPIVVLGARGVPASAIAFFGTALTIAANMRQIRFVFSTAFAPAAARLHAGGGRRQLARLYASATRWSLALTLPAVALFGLCRREIMTFVHPSYTGDTTFILVLLLVPILRCSLAGTALLAAGRAGWHLFNNALCAAVTVVGAWILVPGYGIGGAAAAASAGVVAITAAELIEARRLLKLPLDLLGRRREPPPREPLPESDRPSPYPSAPC
ncbi:MAG: oligosaccharide flippase family protein [Acidobacteria bacterium]|nr:oligosaccharide flippase family protein [Acidobacteriota bacterium]